MRLKLKLASTGLAVLVCLLGLAATAAADSVKVGGSLRLEFAYTWYNQETGKYADDTLTQSTFDITNTRVNVTYLSDDKRFKGFAEVRLKSRNLDNKVETRHAYFEYDWGGGSLLLGQTTSLSHIYSNNQVLDCNNTLIGYGLAYWNRTEQIRLTLGQKHRLRFALESPLMTGDISDGVNTYKSYQYLPALAAGYDINLGNVHVYPWARWEWHRFDAAKTHDWHSIDVGLQLFGDFGLVGFTAGVAYGVNTSNKTANGSVFGYPVFNAAGDRADHKQFCANGELRIGGLNIGGGYQRASLDKLKGTKVWAEDPWTAGAYVNYFIPFGKITFVPEVLWENYGKDKNGVDKGDAFRVGLFAMLTF